MVLVIMSASILRAQVHKRSCLKRSAPLKSFSSFPGGLKSMIEHSFLEGAKQPGPGIVYLETKKELLNNCQHCGPISFIQL